MAAPVCARLGDAGKGGLETSEKRGAHIFVINLDARKDKCACMATQLEHAPYPVTRFSAVSGDALFDHCPNFWNMRLGGDSANNTMALTCSNLEIWEQALALDSEFVIILEDDVILSEDVWSKMSEAMEGACDEWDYIMVDAWHGNPNKPMPEFRCSPNADMPMYDLTVGFGGSHFQIWRISALPGAIDQLRTNGYANPMDKVVHGIVSHGDHRAARRIRAAAGHFNVSFQVGKRAHDPNQLPEECRPQTLLTDDRPVPREGDDVPELNVENIVCTL